MNKYNFFFDAETDGLYGRFLSVAAVVTDNCGNEIDTFYAAVSVTADELSSVWTKENVFPYLRNAKQTVSSEDDLLESFWRFWLKYRDDSIAVAYVQYPVEARLFTACVKKDLAEREYLGPLPLYDLSTLVYSKYGDFNIDQLLYDDEKLDSHDALNDVKMMICIWNRLL